MSPRFVTLLVLLGVASCAESSKPPATVAQSTATEERSSTEVEVSRAADAPPNPLCVSYCKRIGACWLNLSNADPMVAPKDAERRCLIEQSECHRPTADVHCCSKLGECGEFSHCIESSSNVLSACAEPQPSAGSRTTP